MLQYNQPIIHKLKNNYERSTFALFPLIDKNPAFFSCKSEFIKNLRNTLVAQFGLPHVIEKREFLRKQWNIFWREISLNNFLETDYRILAKTSSCTCVKPLLTQIMQTYREELCSKYDQRRRKVSISATICVQ